VARIRPSGPLLPRYTRHPGKPRARSKAIGVHRVMIRDLGPDGNTFVLVTRYAGWFAAVSRRPGWGIAYTRR